MFALDGGASEQLRALLPLDELRSVGAFFTGQTLAQFALDGIDGQLPNEWKVFDPACGAGNLLLAFAERIQSKPKSLEEIATLESRFIGCDVFPSFVKAAKIRLLLKFLLNMENVTGLPKNIVEEMFGKVFIGNGLFAVEHLAAATHILLNPPYTMVPVPHGCSWTKGKVNLAALFVEKCLVNCSHGSRIIAILPDVLRSGTRYAKWRVFVEENAYIHRAEPFGRFDNHANVDVFVLDCEIGGNTGRGCQRGVWYPTPTGTAHKVSDFFNISVGSVVPHRNPNLGPWRPYLCARDVPIWSEVNSIGRNRRYKGSTFSAPFVVVRRTSSPKEKKRAVASIITRGEHIAVENHLIVLSPKDSTLQACRRLLRSLSTAETTNFLNQRIRCRHLTTHAIGELPWQQ
ncbi:MAG: N-6 DNA methylase [Candidatus Lernaella stagnicola]|nr:N-6 DNA methylase [Candidatus Lernaella stagnicola]